MKDFNYFKAKETSLKLALARVQSLLESYKLNTPKGDNWNLTHDLEYRIINRLNDNLSEYCSWKWDNFGYNIY
jgi:hypothetical protein